MKKEMCRVIPSGSCPNCGHKQFVVVESTTDLYLTNRDGAISDHQEIEYKAIGKCCRCGKTYNMISTSIGFIPATQLRSLLYEYSPHEYIEERYPVLPCPMFKE